MDCGRPLKITTAFRDAATGMVNTQPKETRMCEFDGLFGRTNGVAARWMLKGDGPKMAHFPAGVWAWYYASIISDEIAA